VDGVRCLGIEYSETHARSPLLRKKVESQESIADDGMNCVDSTICRSMDHETHRKCRKTSDPFSLEQKCGQLS